MRACPGDIRMDISQGRLCMEMVADATGDILLRETAQSTCIWTEYKSHILWKLTRKSTGDTFGEIVLCEVAHAACTWTFHKSHFEWKCPRKITEDSSAPSDLRERGQSKGTWTCHKSHSVWKFAAQVPDAPDTTSIERRALTTTIRALQCGHAVWLQTR